VMRSRCAECQAGRKTARNISTLPMGFWTNASTLSKASASTGSASNQESKSLNDISASSKSSADSMAKAAATITWILIALGVLALLFVGFWVYYNQLP